MPAVQHSSSHSLAVNERILKECNLLYTDKDKGLVKLAEQVGIKLSAPRKKIVILLIGNHSAGKSSFINWYIEERVQKTGVAIETQGFVLVTSGKKRESLTGNATLHLYPHFSPLEKINGVVDFLFTEISASKKKKFSMITFVDTPGLVDGDMQYPFDVNEAIFWLGGVADLIFVFFDPIGQALCKRTLSIVERMNIEYADKLRFYLSKADDAGNEADRQKVMMQIVQELCKRPGLNRTGFTMPAIFLPDISKETKCMNQIELVCDEIERAISLNIQTTLDALERDAQLLLDKVEKKLKFNDENKAFNDGSRAKALLVGVAASFVLFWILSVITTSLSSKDALSEVFSSEGSEIKISSTVLLFCTIYFTMRFFDSKPELSRKEVKQLVATQHYLKNTVLTKKKQLYYDYLDQSVGHEDI